MRAQLSDSLWWRKEDNHSDGIPYHHSCTPFCMGLWKQLRGRCADMHSSVYSPILITPSNPTFTLLSLNLSEALW
jgi:hypothetical protein